MSEYEKDLEKTVDDLREKLQSALEKQEREENIINTTLYDVKALLAQLSRSIQSLRRLEKEDHNYETRDKAEKTIIKELTATHDAIHDRIINILDRY
jgi:hypothetical protein